MALGNLPLFPRLVAKPMDCVNRGEGDMKTAGSTIGGQGQGVRPWGSFQPLHP